MSLKKWRHLQSYLPDPQKMSRAIILILALVALSNGLTYKKNRMLFDPPFCFVYQRSDVGVCTGYQYTCDQSTTPADANVFTFPDNCASDQAFINFANIDFPERYDEYKASVGK
ncbi:unnamed protein product [Caenorhabditis auriculariae]|uniref:Uncharacterized protein n=1 Tax=Caenorhabditis auriculariae TaxID=2777116 RepID=A0A8S1HSN1_9PELO|nr:unnamed protein product [Caenorhabditis auriculariae]